MDKVLNNAVKPDKSVRPVTSFPMLPEIITQVNQRMNKGMGGGGAFDKLLHLLASHFNYEDRGEVLVPKDTTFGEFPA